MSASRLTDAHGVSATATARRWPVLPPNLYAVPFGIAGLALTWRAAQPVLGTPQGIADALFVLAAALWLALTADLVARLVRSPAGIAREMTDPVRSPFFALPAIVALVLALGLLPHAPAPAKVVLLVSVVVMVALGGWLTGRWMQGEIDRDRFHPGYLLPTVAGGLVAANVAAVAGYRTLGWLLFGIGVLGWLQIGPMILGRLFFAERLPAALTPTLALEVAPPAVGGNAYFALHQGPNDVVAYVFAGYCVLMVLAQIPLIAVYRRLAFSAAFWTFTFSYSAVATYALHWLQRTDVDGGRVLGWSVLALMTTFVVFLGVRSLRALTEGRFFPVGPDIAKPATLR